MKEGSPATQLLSLIKGTGYNRDTYISIGVVKGGKVEVNGFKLNRKDYYLCKAAEGLANGDTVLVIQDGSSFFIIDKVVK